ncbi:hypothetical protein NFJ02_13g14200 [Pycnococcus provasolii]
MKSGVDLLGEREERSARVRRRRLMDRAYSSCLCLWRAVRARESSSTLQCARSYLQYYGWWSADDPLPISCPHNSPEHHHFMCKLSIKRCDDTYERKGRKYGRFYSAAAAAGEWARCARAAKPRAPACRTQIGTSS